LIFFVETACYGQDVFSRKPGLWEVSLHKGSVSISDLITVQQCSSAITEPYLLFSIVPDQEHCKSPKIKRFKNGKTNILTQCRVNKVTVKSTMSLTGNFSSSYQGSFSLSYSKPTTKQSIKALFFDARWLGECPLEMTPGTMRLSNGIIVNVIKDKKAHEIEAE
jgi:hypothetical protein